jgi:hypothetical protein
MTGVVVVLSGTEDVFDGITVSVDGYDAAEFDAILASSLRVWRDDRKRGIWLRISRANSRLIPVAVKHDFYFHHTSRDSITLCKWLPTDAEDRLPLYAHTQVGVGCFVVNADNEVLVVKEKTGFYKGWKVPGGMVDPKEEIADAAVREVLEETGISTRFKSIGW